MTKCVKQIIIKNIKFEATTTTKMIEIKIKILQELKIIKKIYIKLYNYVQI